MAIEKVLLVSETISTAQFLGAILKRKNIAIVWADNTTHAMELLKKDPFDLVICDVKTGSADLLKTAKESDCLFILIVTIVEDSLEMMRLGAFHFLIRPLREDAIEAVLSRAEEHIALIEENLSLRQEVTTHSRGKIDQIIAESLSMKKILEDVSKVAKSNASVFISGESGTGKEVIAHAIHLQSARCHHPYIKVNCAAIPETLIESEFFGHEKGSFTGAIGKRLGRFELAHRGTLLLDEITEIPLGLQAKLLRVIQEQEFERVGGVVPIKVDVRLISTSNRKMKESIDQKIFREDLYYRLNVVPIHLLPLRERKEDILPLAQYFLERLCSENQKKQKSLSHSAREKLLDHHWSGNIRELANVIERTVVMDCSDHIEEQHLFLDATGPLKCPPPSASASFSGMTLQELEKRHILDTLAAKNDNRTQTAEALGISIRTLRNKLKQYRTI